MSSATPDPPPGRSGRAPSPPRVGLAALAAATAAVAALALTAPMWLPGHTVPGTRPRSAAVRPPIALPAPDLPAPSDRSWWRLATAPLHHPPYSADQTATYVHSSSVVAFVFHQVCPTGWTLENGAEYVTPERLARDFAFFRSHHIATLTPAEFVAFLNGRRRVPDGSVFLAFDNGLEGVYRYAFPLAKRYHVHITTFVIGDRTHDHYAPGDKFLSWGQIRAMETSGLVGVESESYDLHSLELIAPHRFGPDVERRWEARTARYESDGAYAARLRQAFTAQRAAFIHHLGSPPTLLVWPFSTYTGLAVLEARAAGYAAAFAVYPGAVAPSQGFDRWALPRDVATFMSDNVPAEYAYWQDHVETPVEPAAPLATLSGTRSRVDLASRSGHVTETQEPA